MNNKSDYIDLIKAECLIHQIDSDLFCAIVNTESAWNPDVMRYEKNFGYLWQPPKFAFMCHISIDTEILLQKMSYGLCQIMGANARWISWQEPLVKLLDPKSNIKMGVEYFKRRCKIYETTQDQISAWNAGSPIKKDGKYINQDYVDRVYSYYCAQKKPGTSVSP